MSLVDKYLFEALDAYPYNLPDAIEALNYALSYDEENAIALCLMGQVHSEQLMQYDIAIDYYERAIQADLYAIKVYPLYIDSLILNQDFDKSQKVIDFALTIKGMDKGAIYLREAILFEYLKCYKKAKKSLKKATVLGYNSDFLDGLETIKKRIKTKMKKMKK